MPSPLTASIGRQRATRVLNPSEAGYVRFVNRQMLEIRNNLLKVIEAINGVTPEAIRFGLEPMFQESQRLVPVDSGKLKASGFLEVRRTTTGATAAIGYDRYGHLGYAGYVHERVDLRHAPPTQAKFLEEPIMHRIDDFRRRVALYITRETGITS